VPECREVDEIQAIGGTAEAVLPRLQEVAAKERKQKCWKKAESLLPAHTQADDHIGRVRQR
jgi:hypothetical protein